MCKDAIGEVSREVLSQVFWDCTRGVLGLLFNPFMANTRWILGVIFAFCITMAAHAAPKLAWKRELGANDFGMQQIVADGSGGAAAVFANVDEDRFTVRYTVVWFNSAGRELYRKTFKAPSPGEAESDNIGSNCKVISATRLAIVIWYYQSVYTPEKGEDTSGSKTFVVSRAGEESEVDEVNSIDGLQNENAANRYGDATGFFSFQLSEDKKSLFLVRTTYR